MWAELLVCSRVGHEQPLPAGMQHGPFMAAPGGGSWVQANAVLGGVRTLSPELHALAASVQNLALSTWARETGLLVGRGLAPRFALGRRKRR